jgi:hypothetical protein
MSAPIPTSEPSSLTAGDTARWLKHLPDYLPADGWLLTYQLVNAEASIGIGSVASGNGHLVQASAVASAQWPAGQYSWAARVTRGAIMADNGDLTADGTQPASNNAGPDYECFTLLRGTIVVQPAFGNAPLDARSVPARMLDMVEAYLLDGKNLKAAQYQIAGRTLERYPLPDLLALRDRLRGEVARENAAAALAAGLPDPRRIYVRFVRP